MPLSRDDVLQGALALLDEVGLDALTMRSLARKLGVQPGAIYWHFKNKQDLLDAMADEFVAGVLDTPLKGRWDEQLAEFARRMADALTRRRDAARVAVLAIVPGPLSLQLAETMLALLADAGLEGLNGLWAATVLGSYVSGYCLDVEAARTAEARGMMSMLQSYKEMVDREQFPVLHGLGEDTVRLLTDPRTMKTRFEFGLRVIIEGLRAMRPKKKKKKR